MFPGAGLPRIQRLPPMLANQIAAGEVVERPASVVKELVENSLDAGADQITVSILKGGVERIRVTDNGHGVHRDDLVLALERHATSKIRTVEELAAIASLGFRGEALPSIAAVGRLTLTSAVAGAEHAWSVASDPRTGLRKIAPAVHPVGTTVETHELFGNVPARRKFLRSEQTEYLHVLDVMKRLALSRPGLQVRLRHNHRTVLDVQKSLLDDQHRQAAVFGARFVSGSVALDARSTNLHLHGRLGLPGAARAETDQQHFYLNGRSIRDRLLGHALRAAYGDLIPAGRQPVYLLYLDLDPGQVDVNVHPTKNEVRFRNGRDVHDFVTAAVREALAGALMDGRWPVALRAAGVRLPDAIREHAQGYERTQRAGTGPGAEPALGRPLAALFGRYILTRRTETFVLVDAAAARGLWARHHIEAAFAVGEMSARPLLVPVEITVSAGLASMVDLHAGLLADAGLELAGVGPEGVMVRTCPVALEGGDLPRLVLDALQGLARAERGNMKAALREVLLAHADQLPAGSLDAAEMTIILRALERIDVPVHAERLRGVWRTLSVQDMKDLIGRSS